MTYKDEPGFGTIMCELGLWAKKKFIKFLWGMEGLREWVNKQSDDKSQEVKSETAEPIKPEPVDNSKELIARIKEFASCPILEPGHTTEAILDVNYNIIEPRIHRRTFFNEYTYHLQCDVDANEQVPWDIAVLYMIGEMEKNNKGKSYTIEEVEEALIRPNISKNKIVVPKPEFVAIVEEFKDDTVKPAVVLQYHTVYGVKFANHLTPHRIVMFKNHYILVLKATNTINEDSFVMKDLPLNDNLIARLIKNGFPTVKVTKSSE